MKSFIKLDNIKYTNNYSMKWEKKTKYSNIDANLPSFV